MLDWLVIHVDEAVSVVRLAVPPKEVAAAHCQRLSYELQCWATEVNLGWQTPWQLSAVPHSSCAESWCAKDQTPLSQETQWLGNLGVSHNLPPIPSQAIQTAQRARGGNWIPPPSKTGLQIPINRSLESLHSIKFLLPRWSGQSGSTFYTQCVSMHEHTRKHVRMHEGKNKRCMHALKLTNTTANTTLNISAIRKILTKREVYPSS